MSVKIFPTLKNYKTEYLPKDILSGIIMAAVSIPISMGYAQIAGVPAVYGLYGSVLPILLFAMFSTSKQFIFGVDAAPAAIVGAALATLGVTAESAQALQNVPLIALFAGLWLLLFYFLHADKIVDFISTPVMGGFISGIAVTIILMQIPKLMGSPAGTGEFIELAEHIFQAITKMNWLSFGMGVGALVILIVSKKLIPKFPMAIVIMIAGVLSTIVFHVNQYGVVLLQAVQPGLPRLIFPDFTGINLTQAVGRALMVAVVIMAETLLSENNFASKNGYELDDRQEILACAAGNLAAGAVGCCPVNGSISRTSMNEQYGGKTQVVSITAGLTMAVVLIGATGFIEYLPVPVLTAIVISALMNVVETHLAVRLFKVSRNEFYIFISAGIGVLFLGTIYGVVIGILLSFVAVILRATNPPRSFRGMIPGKEVYYDLERNRFAYPIKHVIIYRFSENLFFANIKVLVSDIEKSIKEEMLAASLKKRGIKFYITEHSREVNDQMRKLGIGHLIKEGAVRRTILAALHDAGIEQPCPLDIPEEDLEKLKRREYFSLPAEEENTLEEFAWAFGDDAVKEIEKRVLSIVKQIHEITDLEKLSEEGIKEKLEFWNSLGALDEDELLRRMELHLDDLPSDVKENKKLVIELIERRRRKLRDRLLKEHPEIVEHVEERRERLERRLEKQNPDAVKRLKHWKDEEF